MKKFLLAILFINTSLLAGTFEEEHKNEIKGIIERMQARYPNSYNLQESLIQTEIESLKRIYEIKEKYGA